MIPWFRHTTTEPPSFVIVHCTGATRFFVRLPHPTTFPTPPRQGFSSQRTCVLAIFGCSGLSLVRQNSQSAFRVFLSRHGTSPIVAYLSDLPLHQLCCHRTCTAKPCQGSQAGGFHLSSCWLTFSVPAQVCSYLMGSSHPPPQRHSAVTDYQEAEIPKRLPYPNKLSSPLACRPYWTHTHLSAYSHKPHGFVISPRTPRGCLVLS